MALATIKKKLSNTFSNKNTTDSFNDKKIELSEDIKKLFNSVDNIFNEDQHELVIKKDDRTEIKTLRKEIKALKEKIEKEKIEIAVIGQEDTGKSTVLNALIKRTVFPAGTGRTTYTKTKLVPGNKDEVKIKIYSKNNFNNHVRDLIETIKINDFKDFDKDNEEYVTIKDLENFDIENEKHVDTLNKILNEVKNSDGTSQEETNAKKELLEILKHSKKIVAELKKEGGQFLTFDVSKNKHQEYIAGTKNDKDDEDKNLTKPLITEEIIIYSTEIKELEQAVIYDVPGFNSPTEFHKEQTKTMLKQADAIIFVSNITTPNLKDNELNILKEDKDDYGVRLKDKLFVFGNQLDRVNNEEEKQEAKKKLKTDVIHSLFDKDFHQYQDRIIFGSAAVYLKRENIDNSKIASHNNVTDDELGIDELRDKIKSYYNEDRFNVLNEKIENLTSEVKTLFQKIKAKIEKDIPSFQDSESDESIRHKKIKKIEAKFREDLKNKLNEKKVDLIERLATEKPFATNLTDEISNDSFSEVQEEDSFVKNIALANSGNFSKINHEIRAKKYLDFLNGFSKVMIDSVNISTDEYRKELIKVFVDSADEQGIQLSLKEKTEIRKLADSLLELKEQTGRFDYLFERFGLRVLDALIQYPFGSYERKYEYQQNEEEFSFLNSQKNDSNNNATDKKKISIKEMILGKDNNSSTKNNSEDSNNLDENHIEKKEDDLKSKLTLKLTLKNVIDEINDDIKNFREVIKDNVVSILGLETVFAQRIKREVLNLTSDLDETKGKIEDFISQVSEQYLSKDIQKQIEQDKMRKRILQQIDEFLLN